MLQERKEVFTGGGWLLEDDAHAHKRSKIIDAHFHIFPSLNRPVNGLNPKFHLKLWQFHLREWNNFWRKDNGEHTTKQFLQFDSNDIADMPEVNFRLTNYGQAEITVDGSDYILQVYPPSLTNNEAPPERMVAEMNLAGVDMGVIQNDHIYGLPDDYIANAMKAYPDRFIAMGNIYPPEADDPRRLENFERSIHEYGGKGLCFSVEPFSVLQQDVTINDPKFDALWELVRQLEVPIFWFIDDRTFDRVAKFMRRLEEMEVWGRRYPDIQSVITHGPVPAAITHEIGIPDELVRLLTLPNMSVEILFPAKWPDYPYPEGQRDLRQLRDQVGAHKLLWGTDSPFGMGMWCTYRQSLDFIRIHCDFLSQDEKDLILGGNVARLFKLDKVQDG